MAVHCHLYRNRLTAEAVVFLAVEGLVRALPFLPALFPEDSIIEEQGMRVVDRRRGGWNDDAAPATRSTGAKIHARAVRMSPSTRKLGAGLLITLLAMVIFAVCFVAFRTINFGGFLFLRLSRASIAQLHCNRLLLLPRSRRFRPFIILQIRNVTLTGSVPMRNLRVCGTVLGGSGPLLLKSFGPSVLAIRRIRHWNTVFSRKVCHGWTSVQRKRLPGLILKTSTRPSWPFARRILNLFLFA